MLRWDTGFDPMSMVSTYTVSCHSIQGRHTTEKANDGRLRLDTWLWMKYVITVAETMLICLMDNSHSYRLFGAMIS